jgi:hypothetical protein
MDNLVCLSISANNKVTISLVHFVLIIFLKFKKKIEKRKKQGQIVAKTLIL